MSIEEEENKTNVIYSDVIDRLSKMFYEKGYTLNHRFDNEIWFLSNNLFSLGKEGETPNGTFGQKNEIIDIIEKTSSNDNDLDNIDIKVEEFIFECGRSIFEYNNHKIKIEENLSKISLKENLEKIGYIDNLTDWENLEINKEEKKEIFKSTIISYYIWNIKGLKEGEYEIKFVYKLKGNDFHYNVSKMFPINKARNLTKPLQIELTFDNQINIFSDQKIFPIKEYFFEIYRNSKKVFETESISFDPIVIQFVEKINKTNSFRTSNKEDFEESEFNENKKKKYSLNYNLEINFDENLSKEVVRKTILYYESLIKGMKNLEFKINEMIKFFDEKTKRDLIEILKGKQEIADGGSCATCTECLIF